MDLAPDTLVPAPSTSGSGRPSIIERAGQALVGAQARMAREAGLYPFGYVLSHPSASCYPGEGKQQVINFGSSNYLGLSTHPTVVEAAQDAARKFGTSAAGPRLFNGTLALHLELEEELADFYGKQAAAVFPSGFAANVAMLSSLLTRHDAAIFDRHSHVSQREGAERNRIPALTFRHNEPESLRRRLAGLSPSTGFAVCLDGVFSMDGSIAPLRQIAEITKSYGGSLFVDEAHSLGVVGATGRGASEHHDCLADVDLISVSLSKALAGTGGAVIGDRDAVEHISLTARSYIFTASCDPSAVGAVLAALRILRARPELAAAARASGQRVRQIVADAGWDAIAGQTPIVCIPARNRISAVLAWRSLIDAGVYVNVAVPPAVPEHGCLLRIVASAAHSESDFDRLYQALCAARQKFRVAHDYGGLREQRNLGSKATK
ncbi:MAG TPA: aminotransferase class I/II-fold pyridoxal phosphate-dependent enzyme [Streptosporangiaceae bacterium]|nr:aminotransferase class I/II-fold pyridoxal phosphate-dependent enzyme [Streptosporangiaceae bacterium]